MKVDFPTFSEAFNFPVFVMIILSNWYFQSQEWSFMLSKKRTISMLQMGSYSTAIACVFCSFLVPLAEQTNTESYKKWPIKITHSPCKHVGVIEARDNLNFHHFFYYIQHQAPNLLTSTRCVQRQTGSEILSVSNLTAVKDGEFHFVSLRVT